MTRYEQGFMNKCAEHGVDGTELLKVAYNVSLMTKNQQRRTLKLILKKLRNMSPDESRTAGMEISSKLRKLPADMFWYNAKAKKLALSKGKPIDVIENGRKQLLDGPPYMTYTLDPKYLDDRITMNWKKRSQVADVVDEYVRRLSRRINARDSRDFFNDISADTPSKLPAWGSIRDNTKWWSPFSLTGK